MNRMLVRAVIVATLVVGLASPLIAKGPTVRLTIAGGGLTQPLNVTSPIALVNVWNGVRKAQSWWDFPKPFLAGAATEPDAVLPRYTISFYVKAFAEEPQVRVLYVVRYVPDPQTGGGYVYLPRSGDSEARFNSVISRPGQDGRWNRASAEWSGVINAQLAAVTR